MKKLILLFLMLVIMNTFTYVSGYEYHPINIELVNRAKTVLDVNDDGATLLYEKVPITDDYAAWMLGWFWNDYKIVAGITDSGDIIYYNKAFLGEHEEPHFSKITYEHGYEVAYNFINKVCSDINLRLISFDSYTYKFARFVNGVRVYGNDATVVVDKYTGDIYYYQGFGNYDCTYVMPQKQIDKSTALNNYFEQIGAELIYETKYDEQSRQKTNILSYVLKKPYTSMINAQTGEAIDVKMHDYNYYYNDAYYTAKALSDNNINSKEGNFSLSEQPETANQAIAEQQLKNLFYTIRNGYSFNFSYGEYSYFSELGSPSDSPAWQVDIYPTKLKDMADRLVSRYESKNYDALSQVETSQEYVFARAYIAADDGSLLGFDSVTSSNYQPIIPPSFNYSDEVNPRIYEFVNRCTDKEIDLRLYNSYKENEYTQHYCFARYVNNVRVVGEGINILYNKYTKDIKKCEINLSSRIFAPLDGVKSQQQISQTMRNELSYDLLYVDNNENEKTLAYSFKEKEATFNPITGARTDLVSTSEITKIFICHVGSNEYNVNGNIISGSTPIIINGSIYLPIRTFAENLGYILDWSSDSLVIKNDKDNIILDMNSQHCTVNSVPVIIDKKPELINDVTYLSVSSLTKILGMQSRWDNVDNKIIIIN